VGNLGLEVARPRRAQAHKQSSVILPVAATELRGDLTLPLDPVGAVAFAHGSGSSRRSPRNRAVAAELADAGLATLLLDLLTSAEDERDSRSREHRFDIDLLAARVVAAVEWLAERPETAVLPLGLFGASTGAAAALVAAAERPERVSAVVSRGGRPDLAGQALGRAEAPTLLIVGARDEQVLDLNRRAAAALAGEARIEVVPGAGHLFEEPGALDEVVVLARAFFLERLAGDRGDEHP
jgi:putative phosphoribosyl transferase